MGFSETTKKKVMQKAGYCCCTCYKSSVSVEVHHIIPTAEGGDDSIDNAVTLCPSCHSDYGGNPEKRTRIRQMRDWWYETTAQMYASKIASPEQLGRIHESLQGLNVKQNSILKKQDKHETDLDNLKIQLKAISENTIDGMTTLNSDITTSSVLGTAVTSITSLRMGKDIPCNRCGKLINVWHNFCPHCGQIMSGLI